MTQRQQKKRRITENEKDELSLDDQLSLRAERVKKGESFDPGLSDEEWLRIVHATDWDQQTVFDPEKLAELKDFLRSPEFKRQVLDAKRKVNVNLTDEEWAEAVMANIWTYGSTAIVLVGMASGMNSRLMAFFGISEMSQSEGVMMAIMQLTGLATGGVPGFITVTVHHVVMRKVRAAIGRIRTTLSESEGFRETLLDIESYFGGLDRRQLAAVLDGHGPLPANPRDVMVVPEGEEGHFLGEEGVRLGDIPQPTPTPRQAVVAPEENPAAAVPEEVLERNSMASEWELFNEMEAMQPGPSLEFASGDPVEAMNAATYTRKLQLDRMAQQGLITETEYDNLLGFLYENPTKEWPRDAMVDEGKHDDYLDIETRVDELGEARVAELEAEEAFQVVQLDADLAAEAASGALTTAEAAAQAGGDALAGVRAVAGVLGGPEMAAVQAAGLVAMPIWMLHKQAAARQAIFLDQRFDRVANSKSILELAKANGTNYRRGGNSETQGFVRDTWDGFDPRVEIDNFIGEHPETEGFLAPDYGLGKEYDFDAFYGPRGAEYLKWRLEGKGKANPDGQTISEGMEDIREIYRPYTGTYQKDIEADRQELAELGAGRQKEWWEAFVNPANQKDIDNYYDYTTPQDNTNVRVKSRDTIWLDEHKDILKRRAQDEHARLDKLDQVYHRGINRNYVRPKNYERDLKERSTNNKTLGNMEGVGENNEPMRSDFAHEQGVSKPTRGSYGSEFAGAYQQDVATWQTEQNAYESAHDVWENKQTGAAYWKGLYDNLNQKQHQAGESNGITGRAGQSLGEVSGTQDVIDKPHDSTKTSLYIPGASKTQLNANQNGDTNWNGGKDRGEGGSGNVSQYQSGSSTKRARREKGVQQYNPGENTVSHEVYNAPTDAYHGKVLYAGDEESHVHAHGAHTDEQEGYKGDHVIQIAPGGGNQLGQPPPAVGRSKISVDQLRGIYAIDKTIPNFTTLARVAKQNFMASISETTNYV